MPPRKQSASLLTVLIETDHAKLIQQVAAADTIVFSDIMNPLDVLARWHQDSQGGDEQWSRDNFCLCGVSTRLPIEDKADQMSGPIVRTGTTPAFWKNWEQAFGGKKTEGSAKKKATGGEKKPVVAAKKTAKKASKKAAAKKKK